jgi:aspartate/glutamate racemase
VKKIGLIGGMNPDLLMHYYKGLNDKIEKYTRGSEKINTMILSLDYKRIHGLSQEKKIAELIKELIYACQGLKDTGYGNIAFTDSLLNRYIPKIRDNIAVKILSQEEVLGKAMVQAHLTEVLFIREKEKTLDPYYINAFLRYGVNIHEPTLKMQQEIIKYQNYVEKGDLSVEEVSLKLIGMIESYGLKGIHGVVLEGMWLEAVVASEYLSMTLLKSTALHINHIFEVLKEDIS